jgi:hypothetical protein
MSTVGLPIPPVKVEVPGIAWQRGDICETGDFYNRVLA